MKPNALTLPIKLPVIPFASEAVRCVSAFLPARAKCLIRSRSLKPRDRHVPGSAVSCRQDAAAETIGAFEFVTAVGAGTSWLAEGAKTLGMAVLERGARPS